MYDLIGDIHGHSDELVELLHLLGYDEDRGYFSHRDRKVIFVGDFIDRGPQIHRVLKIAKAMIDNDTALAVMGNHEFNAIAYHTPDPNASGGHLRRHSEKNNLQHQATLDQLSDSELAEYLDWFRTLPVAVELDGLRVVHACWSRDGIAAIGDAIQQHGRFTTEFMVAATDENSRLFHAIETVLKGPETPLPAGVGVEDKEGRVRHEMRIRWFDQPHGKTYRQYAMCADGTAFPDDRLPAHVAEIACPYSSDERPVFFGHYWLSGEPKPLASNIACLDYSVAKDGHLCAYRWSGEQKLEPAKFVTVAG
ncbi:MAG: metallophosphoesterase [Planctomycetota bacterium]|nr:metallophosphoesterase [Planctomycetota bacterium]